MKEAICRVRPFGVDLCSGVRTHGRLDAQKLDSFMDQVRAADASVIAQGTIVTI